MGIPTGEAIALGVIQGITEFLPISSDGHLALAQLYFGQTADLALTVILHAGTFLATLVVLRQRVFSATGDAFHAIRTPSLLRDSPGGQDFLFVFLASIPTAIIGLLLKDPVEQWSNSPTIIGFCLLLSAAAVLSTRWAAHGTRSVPTLLGTLVVGIAQGSAVLPGLSRSAMTISTLLWLGLRPVRAFELSFLVSLPAVLGAILLEGRHAFGGSTDVMSLLIGTLVSFLAGVVALRFLQTVLAKGKLEWFAIYLVPLALATIAWGYAKP